MARNRGRALLAAVVGGLGLVAVAASHAAPDTVSLLKVRLGGDGAETRVVIDLDKSASVKVVSDGAADRRVVVMMPGVDAPDGLQGAGRGVVKAWVVDEVQGQARLQMDLTADAKVKRRFLLPPADGVEHYRYVIDVAAAPGASLTKAQATAAAPALRTKFLPAKTAPLPLKKVVVIDAGHGGKDVGASGAHGYEKDINLGAALALKARLEKTGRYKVVMTRNSDVYVPLETRVRIAQRADADLFISLHSDSGPTTNLKGASVYTLSDKASRRSTQFVSKDDWFMKASLAGDQGVRDILFDLTQRATRNRSAVFAQTLLSNIEGEAPLLRRSHRDAGLVVLLAPDVPAVLLEMGFVNNPEDEARLRDPASRARFMDAVGDAIDDHFGNALKVAAR
ncbi:N-acetylmuramoyl-L-alanine amidase family protein [Phenylobacterium sp. VNQ135]|uniref:N-acetylmuramoyl-L-alanine amidase family protein n=1 Tax=Phenylobacterium sp. VNQ135 TaxID=3400922 RepID=UPI003C067CE1